MALRPYEVVWSSEAEWTCVVVRPCGAEWTYAVVRLDGAASTGAEI